MIVLDTNVLSEVLRPEPDADVLAWLAAQPVAAVFTTTVSRAEIFYCLRLLPNGRSRERLWEAVVAIFDQDFAGRLLAFDAPAADAWAYIAAERKAVGRPIGQRDAMIAAITRSRGARLATRNTRDFTGCGLDLLNPWGTY